MLRIGPLNLKGKQCARGRVLASSTNQITITKWQSYSLATTHTVIVLQLTEYDVAPILERHIWSKHIQTLMQVCCRTNLVEHMPCARTLPSVLRPLLHKKTTQQNLVVEDQWPYVSIAEQHHRDQVRLWLEHGSTWMWLSRGTWGLCRHPSDLTKSIYYIYIL